MPYRGSIRRPLKANWTLSQTRRRHISRRCQADRRNAISYRNLHFPPSIIQHAIWLYARFNPNLRDVEELMAERSVEVSYETIRRSLDVFVARDRPGLRGARLPRIRQTRQEGRAEADAQTFEKAGFAPRAIVTDKWRAYAVAFRQLGLTAWHHQAKWKNNRIEVSHVRIRRRERAMQGVRPPGSAQCFLSIHAAGTVA